MKSASEGQTMRENRFPPGWDEERVKKVLSHYEEQTEREAVAEDEAAFVDEIDHDENTCCTCSCT